MMSKYVSLVQLQMLLYPNIPISKYAHMQICKYAKYVSLVQNGSSCCITSSTASSWNLLETWRIGSDQG